MEKRKLKNGFVIVEFLIVIAILIALSIISLKLIYTILRKSQVVSAKVQISQIALSLEQVKNDTGYYPVSLSHLVLSSPPPGMEKGWRGPYVESIPLDPWGFPYFYRIPKTNVFSSPPIVRGRGCPYTTNFEFKATPQTATMKIENYKVASAQVWLNGIRIFRQKDFNAKPPHPQILEKEVNLLNGTNQLSVWIASQPASYLIIYIYGYFPTSEYFILGSYGMDKKEGGTKFNRDIVWYSNKYPNFQ